MKRNVIIHEVGPRDGLQIEKSTLPTSAKIRWIESIASSGVDAIQVGSFVHVDKVPQMADTDQLFAWFEQHPLKDVALTALVLNEKGLDRGLGCGVKHFCMGVSASDTHSRKNTGMSTDDALAKIVAMARKATEAGASVQVSVQSAFGCGYEGAVPKERVLKIIGRYLEAGLRMISLADTAGHAQPAQVEELFGEIHQQAADARTACHFHDTYGLALANCFAAFRAGVSSFESAIAGLGGCPFTAVTGGNVATEDLVHMFQRMGLRPDIRLDMLIEAAKSAEQMLGRPLPGKIHATGPVPEVVMA